MKLGEEVEDEVTAFQAESGVCSNCGTADMAETRERKEVKSHLSHNGIGKLLMCFKQKIM